jgi:hypothetical protein
MSAEDEVCLEMGREVLRMIRDIHQVAGGELGFARRRFTFNNGSVELLLVNKSELADRMEAATECYDVQSVTLPAEAN